jgi:hypothetical protein
LTCAIDESERIAGAGVQVDGLDMDVDVLPLSRQAAKQGAVSMLTRTFATKEDTLPWGDAASVPLHPMSGMPP